MNMHLLMMIITVVACSIMSMSMSMAKDGVNIQINMPQPETYVTLDTEQYIPAFKEFRNVTIDNLTIKKVFTYNVTGDVFASGTINGSSVCDTTINKCLSSALFSFTESDPVSIHSDGSTTTTDQIPFAHGITTNGDSSFSGDIYFSADNFTYYGTDEDFAMLYESSNNWFRFSQGSLGNIMTTNENTGLTRFYYPVNGTSINGTNVCDSDDNVCLSGLSSIIYSMGNSTIVHYGDANKTKVDWTNLTNVPAAINSSFNQILTDSLYVKNNSAGNYNITTKYINVTGNATIPTNVSICFNNCASAYIKYNGTTLILKVN